MLTINPYGLALINALLLSLLTIGALIYSYIFPRKKINLFVLLILVSLLPLWSIFRPGVYESGDFNIHIYRTISFYQNLSEGNLMPSWAGNLNATYGYPLFIFLNPLPYYVMSFFHFLGVSFIGSIKLFLAAGYFFSGIFFYLWAKKETKSTLAAFSGAIFYLFAPYHLVDLHFRADVGEVSFFALLPLFFLAFFKFREQKNILWFLFCSLVFGLMIFSHQAMAVFSLILIIPYFIYSAYANKGTIKDLAGYFLTVLFGLIYSLYAWLPHLYYPKYTLSYLLSDHTVVFPKLSELLFSPWRYGLLFQGPRGELSFLIGYTQVLVLIIAVLTILKKRKNLKLTNPIFLWTSISFFILFMILSVSAFVWNTFPILNTAQFSTRLLLVLVFSISSVAIYLTNLFKKFPVIIALILILTVGYTILNWGNRRLIPQINNRTLINNLPQSTAEGEGFCCMAQPVWILPHDNWLSVVPKKHLQIIQGKGQIKQLERKNTDHEYIVFSNRRMLLKENTWYFPGWKLLIDGKPSSIQYTNKKFPGIITFFVPAGLHKVSLLYNDLPVLMIARIISVISILVSLLFIVAAYLKSVKITRLINLGLAKIIFILYTIRKIKFK